jgi:hypothetical protein
VWQALKLNCKLQAERGITFSSVSDELRSGR